MNDQTLTNNNRVVLLIGGFIAGVACYFLTEENNAFDKDLVVALLVGVFYGGHTAMLLGHQADIKKLLLWSAGAFSFVFLLAYQYFTHVGLDAGLTTGSDALLNFFISLHFIYFLSLAFLQSFRETSSVTQYPVLFENAWNNAALGIMPMLLVALIFGALFLVSTLFKLIGLTFLETFLKEPAFNFPLAGLMFGFVIYYLRDNEKILSAARRFGLAMFRVVGLVVCTASILFLVYLPVAGLDVLWESKIAAPVLLTIVFVSIYYINAFVEDGSGSMWDTVSAPIKVIVTAATIVLPVFVLLGAYAFYLRIQQYGLTADRVYAVPIIFFAMAYSIAYLLKILRFRFEWVRGIARANIYITGGAVLVATLLLLAPISAYSISAANQHARLLSGAVSADQFDFAALKFDNAKPGRDIFDKLVEVDATLADLGYTGSIDALRDAQNKWALSPLRVADLAYQLHMTDFEILPVGAELATEQAKEFLSMMRKMRDWNYQSEKCAVNEQQASVEKCIVWVLDVDGNKVDDYLVFTFSSGQPKIRLIVPGSQEGMAWTWRHANGNGFDIKEADIKTMIENGRARLAQPVYPDLMIGDSKFRFGDAVTPEDK